MIDYTQTLQKSWRLMESHPRLFIPRIASLLLSIIWFGLALIAYNAIQQVTTEPNHTIGMLGIIAIYLLVQMCIVFYFAGMSDNMYQHVTHNEKISIDRSLRFAHDQFTHIMGLSLFVYAIIGIPFVAIILILLRTFFGDLNIYLSAFYIALLGVWVVLTSWRLLFAFPILAVDKEKQVIRASAHFAKVHLRQTIVAWLIIGAIGIVTLLIGRTINLMTGIDILLALIAGTLVVFGEMVMSVWEHIVLFELYLETKHVKVKKK